MDISDPIQPLTERQDDIRNKFLRLALRQIDGNEYSEELLHRHVAVVVKGGNVLAIGRNRYKTHPATVSTGANGNKFCRSIHAEMDAINRVKDKDKLQGAIIYVARKGRNEQPGMSCPCKMCQKAISEAGIKKAVFTAEYGTGTLDFRGINDGQ
jgi:deoxycytidylate deaminase